MWTRKELKEKGKLSFLANYWKTVLAALILAIVLGAGPKASWNFDISEPFGVESSLEEMGDQFEEIGEQIEEDGNNIELVANDLQEMVDVLTEHKGELGIIFGIAAAVGAVIAGLGLALKLFVFNVLEVGGRKYFINNLEDKESVKIYGSAFKDNYIYNVKTMFFRDLYTFLWSLLLVIPGIVKSYSYRMIPYLIAENPEMSTAEAFEKSKAMMNGNKWDAFVLDLSFIGWHLLNALTLGLLGIFYVHPYQYSTNAALYEALKGNAAVEQNNDYYTEMK